MPQSQIVIALQKLILPQTSKADKVILYASTMSKILKLKASNQVKNHKVKFYGQNVCLSSQTKELQIIISEEKYDSLENKKIRLSIPNETITSLKKFPGKVKTSTEGYILYWEGSIITLQEGGFNSNIQMDNQQQIDFIDEKKISETQSQKKNQSFYQEYFRGKTRDLNSDRSSLSPSKESSDSQHMFYLRFAKKSSYLTPPTSDQYISTIEVLSNQEINCQQNINLKQSQDKIRKSLYQMKQNKTFKENITKLKHSKSQTALQMIKHIRQPLMIGLIGGISGCLANINHFI